ncbi:MAG: DUF1015 domain-containing protein [Acidobacteria bacterium]|nr:DUF1015 domain-containing protein [Acidobacteriota bacterium]
MASIHPFRALRPEPEAAPAVSSVPYDVVSTEEARRLVAGNPVSFLHVTRSEIDLPPDADPYSAAVYAKARENLDTLRRTAPLVLDDEPALYFYRLRMGPHEQTGVAGCFSVDEYEADVIKKHERTRRDKEDDRTRHIVALRAQTGVVFLTYKAQASVDTIAQRATRGAPLFDFTAEDGVHHTIWRASREDSAAMVAAFAGIPALYIADGHHRAASAARARAEVGGQADSSDAGTFIAVAFPDRQMQILPYHRLVKDLAGRTATEFLDELRKVANVSEGPAEPRRRGEVSVYLDRRWYAMDLSTTEPADSSHASSLDVALLQRNVLDRLLNIGDVRTDKRIDFVGGSRGTKALEAALDSGKAAVAFSMYPVTIDDLMTISDAGGIMPPKSTWFEPKLRDGLLVHLI